MADERTSAGDPARTLQSLWREPSAAPRRGPRQGLTIDAVVDAATSLADAEGLDALTMRKVSSELGVVAMTLYTYVPGKAELLDLMLDAAYGRMERADTTGLPWRSRVTAVALENRRLFEARPWAASVSTVRPLLDRVLDPAVYPLATRVGSAAGAEHGTAYSPGFAYEFGLGRVLDGLAVLVER